ncbi:MAG TPA: glycoside hydrolase family 3 C-terminal domain-containing protein [Chitinophagaceae bacterium]|nr:glycoside hydrolase family 3 C-terminal domain-containing protein [Chitinophagales bacterium]HPG10637.1 glycoside hydrolase family 3 C-terminal domain-containing protein [Chitinophagaceae bacterium]
MKKLFSAVLLFIVIRAVGQDYRSYPMWNPNLAIELRVNDVVSRLTLEEKVAQMLNATPAIPRLGIPAYDWWNEVLHGVARTPYNVTSYPQAIGMAATWDTNSLKKMADYSATEGRAIHNIAIEKNSTGNRYVGLTYWTPNINIFRDPRWGRGQETYGEDPFLTAKLGAAFVRGLQGDDPKYMKAAACAKHFAVHSGPEPSRHSDNFDPSSYDLWDTYLPAFKELITKADVAGVMCAYNAVNTQPCCANDLLMNDILRRQWNFTGYVTSDCWAVDDFFRYHKTHKDATTSAVDAVIHGTDVECGQTVYKTLVEAVKTGLVKEEQLDISLKRLFTIRYKLGMFDPPSMVKYAKANSSDLESTEHKAHALKMAQQSIVLLKNENSTLPIKKNIRKIAVVGPNADNSIAILGNYNGVPSKTVNLLEGLKEKLGNSVEIHYEKAINFTNDTLLVYDDLTRSYSWEGKPGFKAEYFKNRQLQDEPAITITEKNIDHFWQEGEIVFDGIPANNFSARYTTNFSSGKNGTITFEVEADDGYRFFINGKEVINAWLRNRWGAKTYQLTAKKDSVYKLVLEYWQGEGKANVALRTGNFQKTDFKALAARIKDADVIVFAGGISPQLEGEEMPVTVPGFSGGDRTSIMLPAVQTDLLKALRSTGKPVVFAMMTGSAIAIPWEEENIPAIVNIWYGGQSAGTAFADVLFGDYNPGGRLPVTFYKSDNDLPSFSNYDMTNRTYRYFNGDALYPFGYGLSYTTFNYTDISSVKKSKRNKNITISAVVTNSGKMDGEEVVQLYVHHNNINGKAPLKALKGFQRISLKAGESKKISFRLSPEDLSLVSEAGTINQPKGTINVSIGGGQPGVNHKTTSNVITRTIRIK